MPKTVLAIRRSGSVLVGVRIALFAVLPLSAMAQSIAPPADSLTTLQKLTINRKAEERLSQYMYLLTNLASFTSSDEDAVEAEIMQKAAVSSDEPIFDSERAFIESNVDPELNTNTASRNRIVQDYLKEFRLMFTPTDGAPVEFQVLQRAEPKISDGRLQTSIQYEMRFNGRYEEKPDVPYALQVRVAEFFAVDKGNGNWAVTIASDHSFVNDPTRPFVQFAVDRDLQNVEKGFLTATPELIQLRKAEEAAKMKAQQEEAKKKADYDHAIEAGDKALSDSDPEVALDMYIRAQEIDPLSLTHVARKKKAERELYQKTQAEIDRSIEQLCTDLARQIRDNKIKSVSVPDFTDQDGGSMGKELAERVALRLATNGGFKVWVDKQAAKAEAEIKGKLMRTGTANERMRITATIMDLKRDEVQGGAEQVFPMPRGFAAPAAANPKTEPVPSIPEQKTGGSSVPPASTTDTKKRWSIGLTAGVNLTRITDTDAMTAAYTVGEPGVRVGIEFDRISPGRNSRFATGLRLSQLKCSTSGEETKRVIDVVYLQVPVLYKFLTKETSVGRLGIQVGGLLDHMIHSTTQALYPDTIEVSNFNFHAAPGLCYEVKGPKGSHIVASASYDLMLPGMSGKKDLPDEQDGTIRLHALSFAIGVRF